MKVKKLSKREALLDGVSRINTAMDSVHCWVSLLRRTTEFREAKHLNEGFQRNYTLLHAIREKLQREGVA